VLPKGYLCQILRITLPRPPELTLAAAKRPWVSVRKCRSINEARYSIVKGAVAPLDTGVMVTFMNRDNGQIPDQPVVARKLPNARCAVSEVRTK
jgi:hypothetical protein